MITSIPLWVGLALFSTSLLSHRPLEVSSRVQTMGRGEGGSRSSSVASGRAFTNVEQPAHPPNASAAQQRNAQRIKPAHQRTTSEEAARKKKGRGSRAEQKKRTEESRAEAQKKGAEEARERSRAEHSKGTGQRGRRAKEEAKERSKAQQRDRAEPSTHKTALLINGRTGPEGPVLCRGSCFPVVWCCCLSCLRGVLRGVSVVLSL